MRKVQISIQFFEEIYITIWIVQSFILFPSYLLSDFCPYVEKS